MIHTVYTHFRFNYVSDLNNCLVLSHCATGICAQKTYTIVQIQGHDIPGAMLSDAT